MYSYNNIIDKKPPPCAVALDSDMAAVLVAHAGPRQDPSTATGSSSSSGGSATVERFKAHGAATAVDAALAHDLLTAAECAALIRLCEEKSGVGFTFWAAGGVLPEAAPTDGGPSPAVGSQDMAAAATTTGSSTGKADEGDEALLPGEAEHLRRTKMDSASPAGSTSCGAGGAGKCAMADEAQARAFRTAYTIEGDFPQLAALLWARLLAALPLETKHFSPDMPDAEALFERDLIGTWEPYQFSTNLLFARYLDGGHFAPHVDGSTIVDLNTRSLYTALVYLNTCGGGGETRVFVGEQCDVLAVDAATGKFCGRATDTVGGPCIGSIVPTAGACAVFGYNVLHEGAAVHAGHAKYIIRGDILYRRTPPILTSPADVEAFAMFQRARVLEASGETAEALRLFQRLRRKSPGVAELYQL